MPPRTRSQDVQDGAEVVDIDSQVDLDLDATTSATLPPFRIRLGGKTFSADQPTAAQVLDLGSAANPDVSMALIFGGQWPDIRDLLDEKNPDVLMRISRAYAEHFDLDEVGMARTVTADNSNRAGRRSRRRR